MELSDLSNYTLTIKKIDGYKIGINVVNIVNKGTMLSADETSVYSGLAMIYKRVELEYE